MSAVSCGEAKLCVVQWSRGLQLMMHLMLRVCGFGGDTYAKTHAVHTQQAKHLTYHVDVKRHSRRGR